MEIRTLGSKLTIYDDYIKNNPEKCLKIKKQLIKIKAECEKPKFREVYPVSHYPITTEPYADKPVYKKQSFYSHYKPIDRYERVFNDCLPGKAWVEAHYQDVIPEPTIEVSIDGKAHKFNGTYKRGIVKELLGGYCRPGEGKIRLVKV